jgi:hypothetical protein
MQPARSARLLVAAVSTLLASSAHAQLIRYAFGNNLAGGASAAPTITNPNISSSFVLNGINNPGIQLNAGNHFQALFGLFNDFANNAGNPGNLAHTIRFDVTIAPGYSLDISSLGYDTLNGANFRNGLNTAIYSRTVDANGPANGNNLPTDGWGYPGWTAPGGSVDSTSQYGFNPRRMEAYGLNTAPAYGGGFTNLTGTHSFYITAWVTNYTPSFFGDYFGIDNIFFDGVVSPLSVTAQWNVDNSGNWSDAANWTGGIPNGVGHTANFGTITSAGRTVTAASAVTVGTMNFNSPNMYTVGGAGVTLDVATGSAGVNVVAGSHVVDAPLTLNDNLNVNVAAASSVLSVNGAVAGAGRSVTKSGAGQLQLRSGELGDLNINAGSVKLTGAALDPAPKVTALNIAADASLDVGVSALVIDYATTSPLADVRAKIIAGLDGQQAGESVIVSSDNVVGRAIGYGEASALSTISSVFGTPDASAVLVRRTFAGDINLDGSVNFSDLLLLAQNYNGTSKTWTDGDVALYDGNVNFSDLLALASSYNQSLSVTGTFEGDWALALASVPEPTTFTAMLAASLLGLSRKRR